MDGTLSYQSSLVDGKIDLTASKSESNRALVLNELAGGGSEIFNLAAAEDTRVLQELLVLISRSKDLSEIITLDVGLAGTAMRFLTAFLSITPGNWILTGAERMKQRPIQVLVEAINELGGSIEYLGRAGYPPLKINGKDLDGQELIMDGSVSSQYVSALLMIAPLLSNGLSLSFKGGLISKPYVEMTVKMMEHYGSDIKWTKGGIRVGRDKYEPTQFLVEADWSSASYWYGFVALSAAAELTLTGLKEESLQGDSAVVEIYKQLGVDTKYTAEGIVISKGEASGARLDLDFSNCPDIAQTVTVTIAALNREARLTGLTTLRIKETDRISALQVELNALGYSVDVEQDDIIIRKVEDFKLCSDHLIRTYDDHRMAMAFAPLCLVGNINIEDVEVVKKSYPDFWKDLKSIGVQFENKIS